MCQVLVGTFPIFLYERSIVAKMNATCLSCVPLLSHPDMVLFSLFPTNARLNALLDAVCIVKISPSLYFYFTIMCLNLPLIGLVSGNLSDRDTSAVTPFSNRKLSTACFAFINATCLFSAINRNSRSLSSCCIS